MSIDSVSVGFAVAAEKRDLWSGNPPLAPVKPLFFSDAFKTHFSSIEVTVNPLFAHACGRAKQVDLAGSRFRSIKANWIDDEATINQKVGSTSVETLNLTPFTSRQGNIVGGSARGANQHDEPRDKQVELDWQSCGQCVAK